MIPGIGAKIVVIGVGFTAETICVTQKQGSAISVKPTTGETTAI